MSKSFIDSNIFVYANDRRDPRKQSLALSAITTAIRSRNGVVSTQVLGEFAVVALGKLRLSSQVVARQLTLLEQLEIVPISAVIVRRALELHQLHQTHFWDAQILAASEAASCDQLLSEDFNVGAEYSGIRVINPFEKSA